MKVSLNQITQYIDFELPPTDELVKRINEQLGGVEEVIDVSAKYSDAVIVTIVSAEQHPNADRLRVCKIDDGGKTPDVPRDENGLVQVVCGAPNAEAGKTVVWLPPKSIVPASFDDSEPFVLDARELRGVLSQGMLAAADELAIGSDHEGILEVDPNEWKPSDEKIVPGANFAKVYGLDDTIIDIENKMFTHRPDCFGQLGVAREIAGILGHKFTSPSWYLDTPTFSNKSALPLEVFNDESEKVPRFMAVAMKNIVIKPSPLWLQCALVAMGSKPINNIVDVTNYVMLLTAQPTHAYDYDKIRGHKLGARMAQAGETIKLLNDKTYELMADDIVIADSEGPIGLAGIMGGGDSEVDENTKNIILEVATFDMYAVRKSAMRHGVFTDALTRFNKGQSPLQNDHIMNLLMMSVKDVSSAEQASEVFDEKINMLWDTVSVSIGRRFIQDRLGGIPHDSEISNLLENVEFTVTDAGDGAVEYAAPTKFHDGGSITVSDNSKSSYGGSLVVKPPFWRTDIELPEDVVEEIGRLYGFDKLPRELPPRSIKPAPENALLQTKQAIREKLSRAGANEVLTYSFVHGKLLEKCGQDPTHAYQLSNALSPDLQYYRLSLMPSLLSKVHANVRAGHSSFVLFEIGKGHSKDVHDDGGLPREDELTACVVVASDASEQSGAAFYRAKKYLTNLLGDDITVSLVPEAAKDFDITKPYEHARSGFVYHGDEFLGIIGEFRVDVQKNLKLPNYCAGFELDTEKLVGIIGRKNYTALSRYPSIEQDISLKTSTDISYQDLFACAKSALDGAHSDDVSTDIACLDIYQRDDDMSHKQTTFRITATSHERTLKTDEVSQMLEQVSVAANEACNAERL